MTLNYFLTLSVKAVKIIVHKFIEPHHKFIFFLRYQFLKKPPFSINYYQYKVYYKKGDGSINHLAQGYRYEKEVINLATTLVGSDPVIFDIGANIGLISLGILAKIPNATFHCFEPSPYPFKYLSKTIKENKLDKKIRLNNIALFNKNSRIPFFVHQHKDALGDGIKDTKRAGPADKIYIKAQRLDDYVKRNKIKKIELIKVDVEGSELFVLDGSIKTLKKFHPAIIFEANNKNIMVYKKKPEDIYRFLNALNYKIYSLKMDNLNEKEFVLSSSKIDNYLAFYK